MKMIPTRSIIVLLLGGGLLLIAVIAESMRQDRLRKTASEMKVREDAQRKKVEEENRIREDAQSRARKELEFQSMSAREHCAEGNRSDYWFNCAEGLQLAIRHFEAIPVGTPEHEKAINRLPQLRKWLPKAKSCADVQREEQLEAEWTQRNPLSANPILMNGVLGKWEVTFQNRSAERIGDILYKTHYYSETNRLLGEGGGVIMRIIEPKDSRTVEVSDGLQHSQVARGQFEIISWKTY